ncbi:MAG TPA: hypothetical protein DCY48_00450 [Candidatus Magasanikbacteria bacterium]|nr:MAG: hypothetical protein A3I74_02650 [Candidatus Magasanikbacteria bacterium RIFCSPLOWO2_02_FULL_47_16]OGH79601.1 MAG: hypothetical protein A3C10_00750 [Candidatus Magasanikbacteria bacterium RIFCSPHIGHO2_02_FULL_48_18]OGH82016.1 MAG: hypothetical protein A3G08_02260 [Candidatus Magasanikbacteria bacterium RIFCSPLOWO2_12_FULL_47_9b]HAZ28236.1 hypothetical protein [Candidatus Magasanikbacteria bacterium]
MQEKKKTTDIQPAINGKKNLSFGQRSADRMTKFLGNWTFIFIFLFFLLSWMSVNTLAWWLAWDPFPFILLNLCLSSLAAFQAPIIMMSQNRQAERDSQTAKYDYAVDRKAEREIQAIQQELAEIKSLLETKLAK